METRLGGGREGYEAITEMCFPRSSSSLFLRCARAWSEIVHHLAGSTVTHAQDTHASVRATSGQSFLQERCSRGLSKSMVIVSSSCLTCVARGLELLFFSERGRFHESYQW